MGRSVEEFIKEEVPDWEDDVVSAARFKAFSGQRVDWEHRFFFWRDLIVKIARHLRLTVIDATEVRNHWFVRNGLTPLCIDRVLLEMYNDRDILRMEDLLDPSSGALYKMFRKAVNLIGITRSRLPENIEGRFTINSLVKERAAEIIKSLCETHWTSSCIITMGKFRILCKSSDEASAIFSYLSESSGARYLLVNKAEHMEGMKLSLLSGPVPAVTTLDYERLHLIWTMEMLQQKLDVIDSRCTKEKNAAITSLKCGNRGDAQRYVQRLKLTSQGRSKCMSLLSRVEEVLGIIADAESTKQVTEAIKIGSRAIKENGIGLDEVNNCLQEINEAVDSQKEAVELLESESFPSFEMDMDDEEIEEEFKKLEAELGDDTSSSPKNEEVSPSKNEAAVGIKVQNRTDELVESLSNSLSKVTLEPA